MREKDEMKEKSGWKDGKLTTVAGGLRGGLIKLSVQQSEFYRTGILG